MRQIAHPGQSEPSWTRSDRTAITVPATTADGDHGEATLQAPSLFDAAVLDTIRH